MPQDDNAPATKKDLNELGAELRAEMRDQGAELRAEIRAEFRADMETLRVSLVEQMREMQTEVLRAFYSWARPFEIKLRTLPQLDERLGLLEERVSAIERGTHPAS